MYSVVLTFSKKSSCVHSTSSRGDHDHVGFEDVCVFCTSVVHDKFLPIQVTPLTIHQTEADVRIIEIQELVPKRSDRELFRCGGGGGFKRIRCKELHSNYA